MPQFQHQKVRQIDKQSFIERVIDRFLPASPEGLGARSLICARCEDGRSRKASDPYPPLCPGVATDKDDEDQTIKGNEQKASRY